MKKPVVFFGCSMRGGHANISREKLAIIPSIIEELGCELVSKHQTVEGIIKKENFFTKSQIHDRDYEWLLDSDLGIFEISNPSLGVGAEISDMVHNKKPVLCVYNSNSTNDNDVSAYVLGKQGSKFTDSLFECINYSTFEELRIIIREFFSRVPK
ncbi:MAG: nucleoside 2-deoxyribosyltransferase [Candidatus Paceibacterota bacterium]|jgi:hypothetical protein|nr:nucleoside 2-deoxyribosyltransferase [bacterium]